MVTRQNESETKKSLDFRHFGDILHDSCLSDVSFKQKITRKQSGNNNGKHSIDYHENHNQSYHNSQQPLELLLQQRPLELLLGRLDEGGGGVHLGLDAGLDVGHSLLGQGEVVIPEPGPGHHGLRVGLHQDALVTDLVQGQQHHVHLV